MSSSDLSSYPQQSVSTAVENPFAPYFGAPLFPLSTDANARTSFDRYDLPVAYNGKNIFMAEVIDSFILSKEDTDWTSVILPMKKTDQLNIAYNTWHFNETLAGRVPHEGASRLIRSNKSSHSDKLVRRGLSFMLEHGFALTEQGRQQYVRNIQEIVKAVQITMSFDVLTALLTCKRYNVEWERQHGFFDQRIPDIMKREVNLFGIVQKDINGFDIAIEEHKKMLSRYAVSPDALILPSKLQMYIPMAIDSRRTYYNRGDLGVKQFEEGPLNSYRGVRVFESKTYDLNDGELPVNLMSSVEQIGQFNNMSTDENFDEATFKSSHRDILIYDADADNFRKVSYMKALKHSFRWNSSGELDTDSHDRVAMSHEHVDSVNDAFIYTGPSGKHFTAKYFGEMHMSSSGTVDYLSRDLISKVIQTAVRDIPAKAASELTSGLATLFAMRKSKEFNTGGRGFLFANIYSQKDSSADLQKVVQLMESVHTYLQERFPDSAVLKGLNMTFSPAEEKILTDDNLKGMAALFETTFNDSGVSHIVEQRVEDPAALLADIGTMHDMNVSALTASAAGNVGLYQDAVSKYDVGHDMHSKIIRTVSKLVKTHAGDLNAPEFTGPIKMLGKMGGTKKDLKTLERMGVDLESSSSSGASEWVSLPVAWCDDWESNPNIRKVPRIQRIAAAGASADEEDAGEYIFSRKKRHIDASVDIGAEITDVLSQAHQMSHRLEMVKTLSSVVERLAGVAFLWSHISLTTLEAMHVKDVYIPLDIVLSRPFMGFEMFHSILCKSGADTGQTYVGHSDFMLGDDVRTKLHQGHYTFYAKSIVHNPKNIVLMKNVFINDYRGGFNTDFFTEETGLLDKHEQLYVEDKNRPSIFAMVVPAGHEMRSNPVDLRTEFPYYSEKLGFDSLSEPNYAEEHFVPNSVAGPNAVVYRGMQYDYDPSKKSFSKITIGSGHLGSNIYPGVMAVYTGAYKYVKEQNYVQSF